MIKLIRNFKRGLSLGDETFREFEIRPSTTRDLVNAEDHCPVDKRLSFRIALAGQQLLRIGTLVGPIAFDRVQELSPEDIDLLLKAQEEVEAMEKKQWSDGGATSPSSPESAPAPGGVETK